MVQLTVNDLYKHCQEQIKKGNGNKLIVISDDNEGNGFHGLVYDFTEITDVYEDRISDSLADTPDRAIILG